MTATTALRQSKAIERRPRTCFIAAPAGVDVGPLVDELGRRGIAMPDAASFSTDQVDRQTLARVIDDVDVVVGVISSDAPDPNVLIELGMAAGANRPLLLLVEPQAELPWILRGAPSVRARPVDIDAVRFHLDVFLPHIGELEEEESPPHIRRKVHPSRDAVARAEDRLSGRAHNGARPSEQDLVDVLADLFQSARYITVGKGGEQIIDSEGPAPDLAIWVDELQDWGINPLLIMVMSDEAIEPDAVRQMKIRVKQAQSYLGLIVHWNDETPYKGPTISTAPWPLIAQMSARDVIDALRDGRFAAALQDLLTQSLHIAS